MSYNSVTMRGKVYVPVFILKAFSGSDIDTCTCTSNNDLENTRQKTKIEQTYVPHQKRWVKSGALEGKAVPSPLVVPVILL